MPLRFYIRKELNYQLEEIINPERHRVGVDYVRRTCLGSLEQEVQCSGPFHSVRKLGRK